MKDINFLKYKAYKLREDSLKATTQAGSGHLTTALSAADIVAVLFFNTMNYNLENPFDMCNDRFILSKGHGIPVVYSAFKELGVITNQELLTYRQINSVLEGHPTSRFIYNEAATGSLGQGLSIGLGMALAARLSCLDYYTYVMLGDSEMTEGSNWEAIELTAYYKIHNLIAIVDFNRLGQSTETIDDHDTSKHANRWKGFGWHTIIINGHNIEEIIKAFDSAKKIKNQPTVIIAKTYKGEGLDLVEDEPGYHGKALPKEKLPKFLENLKERFKDVSELNFPEPKKITPVKLSRDIPADINLPDPEYKKSEFIATRKVYGQTLSVLGQYCEKLLSLDAEVKNSTYAEIFEKAYPERFIQCFIAEQNMIGMASGLTLRGFIPFSSTFASFLTRAHDQIRMSSIGKVPLRIAGSHAGVSIGQDGPSQMGLEDIAFMRALPESIIFYPCDAVSTYKLINLMINYHNGISYVRLTRGETEVIYDVTQDFYIGGCKVLKESDNDQVCIIAAGITVFEALKAYKNLKLNNNISVSIIDLYCVKPLDYKTLVHQALKANKKVITVEDHYIQGGIGEAICRALCNYQVKIQNLAVTELPRSGKPEELLDLCKINYKAIEETVHKLIKLN